MRAAVGVDDRIGFSHTQVPGPDGKKGFGGTCFPKDLSSLIYHLTQVGTPSNIMGSAKYRNESIDRPERDWQLNTGRAVV